MRIALGALLVLFAASPAAAGYDCQAAKLTAAAKSALCRHRAIGSALTPTPSDLARCVEILSLGYDRAERRFGVDCASIGDVESAGQLLAWGAEVIRGSVAAGPFVSPIAARCASAKLVATGRLVSCRLAARAQSAATGKPAALAPCEATFAKRMARIEASYGAECPTTGDTAALSTHVARITDLSAPNVVLVYLDDTRYDFMQHLPAGVAPNLQRLADEGIVFENAFSPTPICAPARGSMLTGLRIQGGVRGGHGVTNLNNARALIGSADDETIGTWFADAGRDAGFFGKYENLYSRGTEYEIAPEVMYVPPGWTHWRAVHSPEFFGGLWGATWWTVLDDGSFEEHKGCCKRGAPFGPPGCYVNDPACLDDQTYQTDVLSAQVDEFLMARTKPGWVAVVTPFASHGGHAIVSDPAARHIDTLLGIAAWRPPSWNAHAVGGAPQWQGPLLPQTLQPAFSDNARRTALESLLAVDEALGDLFDRLAMTGELDRTIIMLTSDNGVTWGEHAEWGQAKECPYEPCQRVPLVVRMPDAVHRVVTEPIVTADLAPTIADLGEVGVSVATDGRSFRPLLVGEAPTPVWRTDYCMEYRPHTGSGVAYYGVRDVARGYTYVEHANGVHELYDLGADPWQLMNVIADESYEGIRAELAQRLGEICG